MQSMQSSFYPPCIYRLKRFPPPTHFVLYSNATNLHLILSHIFQCGVCLYKFSWICNEPKKINLYGISTSKKISIVQRVVQSFTWTNTIDLKLAQYYGPDDLFFFQNTGNREAKYRDVTSLNLTEYSFRKITQVVRVCFSNSY